MLPTLVKINLQGAYLLKSTILGILYADSMSYLYQNLIFPGYSNEFLYI